MIEGQESDVEGNGGIEHVFRSADWMMPEDESPEEVEGPQELGNEYADGGPGDQTAGAEQEAHAQDEVGEITEP